jgi:hypothetical protein
LHGLLSRIRDLGLTLVAVQRIGEKSTQSTSPEKISKKEK